MTQRQRKKWYNLDYMNRVIVIPALGDNYIYLYKDELGNAPPGAPGRAFVVDPGESRPVFEALNEHVPKVHQGTPCGGMARFSLNLKAVLVTHYHFDHTGGIDELKRKTNCKIINPDSDSGKIIEICDAKIQIIDTPGHTRNSVCYYVQPSDNRSGILFTGDTLFIGGCGRLIGCDARTMWSSLEKIAALPDDTLVYPGHNYTLENYEFASQIAPHNLAIQNRLQQIRKKQQGLDGLATIPSTIAQEKATNIFLLANTPEIKSAINMPNAADYEVFAELRHRKDIFG
jgi:hydroxyacylglutathione hydrolase